MNNSPGPDIGTYFQRVLQQARKPRSLPGLIWKNLTYLLAPRRPEQPHDPRTWNNTGRALAARGRNEEALACYDRALAISGDIPQIWANRGRALRNLDRLDEAEKSLREALRLKPEFANAHRELGNVLDYLGRFEEAEASVRSGIASPTGGCVRSFQTRVHTLSSRACYRSPGELSHGVVPPTGESRRARGPWPCPSVGRAVRGRLE